MMIMKTEETSVTEQPHLDQAIDSTIKTPTLVVEIYLTRRITSSKCLEQSINLSKCLDKRVMKCTIFKLRYIIKLRSVITWRKGF